MKNNPVQIVLNVSDYISIPESNAGGHNTDFYAYKDREFEMHKQKLLSTVYGIKNVVNQNESSSVFAHVILHSDSLAKSHRPIRSIFPTNKVEYVGGGHLGEMLVELNSKNIDIVLSAIEKAETTTNVIEKKNGKKDVKPSRNKSEVGAISEIRLHQASDKRMFSIENAIEWLSDIRTGGVYFIETFFDVKKDVVKSQLSNLEEMEKSFEKSLFNLDDRVHVYRSNPIWEGISFFVVKINDFDVNDRDLHKKIITFCEDQPMVKRIHLSPIIKKSDAVIGCSNEDDLVLPTPEDLIYPVVGIVDSGVSKNSKLDAWSVGSIDVTGDLQDSSHGTFIAGLVSVGAALNKDIPLLQETPCKFYDVGLFATDSNEFKELYPKGFYDFLQQLDFEIPEAKKRGVRVFNMSLSMLLPVKDDSYSFFASVIDEISDNHDVIFVLPAGNLESSISRDSWPDDSDDVMTMLAKYRYAGRDRILQPCESIRSISVGALDPAPTINALKPSNYTRRGPGPALGIKPDLAQIGGFGKVDAGLYSLSQSGKKVSGCGTSYAAPLVAKSLAILNSSIEGGVSREVLISLMIHNAVYPDTFGKKLLPIARDFIGHGVPVTTSDIVLYDDHSISLVFNATLKAKQELKFDFTWPSSLMTDRGGCRGHVALTLVYTPDCSYKYGHEFVRTNVDCYLRQLEVDKDTGEMKYVGRLKDETSKTYERSLIENGMKWWPIKKYKGEFRSRGDSSAWQVVVNSLSRIESSMPEEGVNFSVILTISDPDKKHDIFNEVRRSMIAQGLSISDIRATTTVRTTV